MSRASKTIDLAARGLGVVAATGLALAWCYAVWVPSAGIAPTGTSFIVGLGLALGAVIAAIAAFRGHAVVVTLVFIVSFFPIGAALLTADHWLRWIGVLDIALLASAVGIWLSARRIRPVRDSQER